MIEFMLGVYTGIAIVILVMQWLFYNLLTFKRFIFAVLLWPVFIIYTLIFDPQYN